jgi:Trp operon repressor
MMKETMFAKLLHNQSNIKDISDLLEGLLTSKELAEIERRIQIVEMLKADVPQHEIAEKLSVGVSTVTRGSKELQNGHFSQIKANSWRNSPAT